jgi:hypothetical protein
MWVIATIAVCGLLPPLQYAGDRHHCHTLLFATVVSLAMGDFCKCSQWVIAVIATRGLLSLL